MKSSTCLILFICALLSLGLLPARADADSASLLAQAQAANPTRYQFAVDQGAEIRATTDNRAFSIWWQPAATTPPAGTLVTLHGHGVYATDDFYLWQATAERYGFALLALQWWFGGGEATSDYYQPNEMYPLLAALLKEKGIPAGTALFTGFSRGAAVSYALTALDANRGGRYFGLTLSNAGGAASGYPPNREIAAGTYGSKPFNGVKWAMYCGELDPDPTINGCPAMNEAKAWVEQYGATVVLFIDDPKGTHGGFMLNAGNVDSAVAAFAAILAARGVPVCTLATSATSIKRGASATLTAQCNPAATSYAWGETEFSPTAQSGVVSPTRSTRYSVAGRNAAGYGVTASATVSVKATANPLLLLLE